MPRIFISYRRLDSGPIAGRIYDRLATEFGKSNVFKDSYNINPGDDFRDVIRKNIASCEVLIVVIGPNWLTITGSSGQRRLDEPDDWVRSEIEAGTQSKTTTVIPILVSGASIPSAAALPASIRELAFRNGIPVRDDPDFHQDVNRLIASLRKVKGADDGKNRLMSLGKIGGIFVIALTLVLAFLALLSEEWRNDFFYKVGLYTATPLALVQNSTDTPQLPTETATNTPSPQTSTNTPQTTSTPTPTTVPPTNTDSPTSIPESVSLAVDPLVVQRGQDVTISTSGTICTFNPSNGNPFTIQTSSGNIIWPAERQPGTTIDLYCEEDGMRSATVTLQVAPPTNAPNPTTNTPLPTIPAASANTITLTIFRDQDSLTLFMPKTDQPLSLAEFIFQVEIAGQNRQFPILNYSSFGGNSILGNVNILNSAACFRLVRSGSRSPAPLECQSGALPLTQNVADADVFWYDSTANQHRTVLVLRDGSTLGICAAGQTRCEVDLPLAAAVEVVNVAATATPGYPCEATITNPDSNATVFSISVYQDVVGGVQTSV